MAGRGPAPKDPALRRNRTPPQAGEWITLPPLERAMLPKLPARAKGTGSWSPRTKAAWAAWRADPVTSQYGTADIQLALDLAYLYEEWVREPTAALAGEIRQRQDSLGLTPKGRQDRRWRLPPAADVVQLEERKTAAQRMEEMRQRAASAGRAS